MATKKSSDSNSPTAGKTEALDFWCPSYHALSNKEEHTLFVAMTGIGKSGVNVALESDQLTITGHRADPVPEAWTSLVCEMGQEVPV